MGTLEKDIITPVEWLTDYDFQEFDNEWGHILLLRMMQINIK